MTTERLLETADHCRRLAGWIIDRPTEALLQLAEECAEKAEELRKQTGG